MAGSEKTRHGGNKTHWSSFMGGSRTPKGPDLWATFAWNLKKLENRDVDSKLPAGARSDKRNAFETP